MNTVENPKFSIESSLFIFDDEYFYDTISIFAGSVNTILVFFFVSSKLSNRSHSKHSEMFDKSLLAIISYYLLFIFLKFFPISLIDYKTRFLLYPNYISESKFTNDGLIYYLSLAEIMLNIFNQIFLCNFYWIIIKAIGLRKTTTEYFKKKK